MTISTKIDVPFCEQRSDSASCGPCCLKMVLDYYNKRRNRKKYTKMALVRLARTSAEYGTSYMSMRWTLMRAGLKVRRIKGLEGILAAVITDRPVIACIMDPGEYKKGKPITEWHYVVVTGFKLSDNLFAGMYVCYDDPYYGPGQVVRADTFEYLLKPDSWMIEVSNV